LSLSKHLLQIFIATQKATTASRAASGQWNIHEYLLASGLL